MEKKLRNHKRALCFLTIILIAALLCMQAGAINLRKVAINKDVPLKPYAEKPFTVEKLGKTLDGVTIAGNALVSIGSPDNDLYPAITRDQFGNIVVTWHTEIDLFETYVGFGFSADGAEWNSIGLTLEGIPKYSDVAYVHGADFEGGGDFTGLWGVYGDIGNNQAGFYRISDINDETTYEFYYWTTEYEDTTYTAISDHTWYSESNHGLSGPTNMYIYHEIYDQYDIEDCPNHWYVDGALEEGGAGYFDAQSQLLTAPAYDCDMECLHDSNPAQTTGDFVILTWHYTDPTSGKSAIVMKKIVPAEEPDIEYTPYQEYLVKSDTYDAKNPNIGASGNNAVITYMTNEGGNWDIKALYSSDGGGTWSTSNVAATSQDETYPAVYMSGSSAYCVYISQGNLYFVESETGGATWGEPIQVNDVDGTVVNEENSADIHSAGIVWMDNREDNIDIYFATAGNAPATPSTPDGSASIRTNAKQTYTTSTTDPNNDQIYYLFSWGDGTDSGWVGPFDSGATGSADHRWSSEGNYEIKVKAKDTNDLESGWSDPLPISVPRSRSLINLNLPSLIYKILEHFGIYL